MDSTTSLAARRATLWKTWTAGLLAVAMVAAAIFYLGINRAPNAETVGLQINSLKSPVGVSLDSFSMSWQNLTSERGSIQESYEIELATTTAELADSPLWSSGRVRSREQVGIQYEGAKLKPATKYLWQVRTWSGLGGDSSVSLPASFETELDPAQSWPAQWIGGIEHTDAVERWADYTTNVEFSVESGGLGVYLRAASLKEGYLWQLGIIDGKTIFRPQVKVNGNVADLGSKDISSVISAERLLKGRHALTTSLKGPVIVTMLDGIEIDRREDQTFTKGYVGFYQTSNDQGKQNATIYAVKVTSASEESLLDTAFADRSNPFTSGRSDGGKLVLLAPTDALYRSLSGMPLLRTDFEVNKSVASARLYAAARGIYETTLNGRKVGDEWLAPGWTDYNKGIKYQSFDVTDLLSQGHNAWGAMIADGWYSGNIAALGTAHYGESPSFLGQLRIEFTDGSHQVIGTDQTWKTKPGPVVQGDLIMGETFDASADSPGWTSVEFDDSAWNSARKVPGSDAAMIPQTEPPVRKTGERVAQSRTETAPGVWVYDMGQNLVGVGSITATGTKGERLRIRYGETISPDGSLYTANLRSAIATDDYIFSVDGKTTIEPRFTTHGFRYIEISGVSDAPTADAVHAIVLGSDLPLRGTFSTSSPMLNQLQSNILWSQRGNFLSIPTDTPARDERLGWTADIGVFAATASYNQDTLAFLSKWLKDARESQLPNGDLPGTAPSACACFEGGTGWSDAIVTVPYALWQYFGDTAVVRDNYEAMKRFMDFQVKTSGTGHIRISGPYGDWLNLDDPTDPGLLGTAYFAYTARLMAEMAQGLGNAADAKYFSQLAGEVKNAFIFNYVRGDGSILGGSQTGYALAIGMSLLPENLRVLAGTKLEDVVQARGGHLSTGFLGTPWLLKALSQTGNMDLSFSLLTSTSYPSWGYEIGKGATTLWERWDGIRPDGTFQDPMMNSLNHYAAGSVGEWMYANIGGIQATKPGFKEFVIAPHIGGGLTHANASVDSPYGPIKSAWSLAAGTLELNVTVPANTEATIRIPSDTLEGVNESGHSVLKVKGVLSAHVEAGDAVILVGSGDYRFSVAAG
ncbi:glycoside hydrolase family 78 protein [Arthrobacter cryoconiti]|uniref:alpha-L-rhamnosidase n=1 Tax=Arthrobacter cryoconiti TaxID=748907 RepID=A0ABV8R206_9MICC|nr:glycoside hydrolase family 78 protein [Arthrobacter cryoconiti]MCC9068461.1 glycoside hydrolase family 78 protein [Arthrobacter cryoconiti]